MRFDLWLLGYRKYRVPQAQAELLFAFFEKSLLFPRGFGVIALLVIFQMRRNEHKFHILFCSKSFYTDLKIKF